MLRCLALVVPCQLLQKNCGGGSGDAEADYLGDLYYRADGEAARQLGSRLDVSSSAFLPLGSQLPLDAKTCWSTTGAASSSDGDGRVGRSGAYVFVRTVSR